MGGTRKCPRCRGDHPVLPYPIDRRLRLCARVGTQHLFVVVRRRSLAGPCASPRSGGNGCPCARPLEAATGRLVFVVGRPVCKPPERGARAPVCKAAQGGHRQARRGLWWPGVCGVLAAGARARRAACAGCVPRSREAAGRAIRASETPRASCCRRGSSMMMSTNSHDVVRVMPCLDGGQPFR